MIARKSRSRNGVLATIRVLLEEYRGLHPRAKVEAKRQNSVSVRIRIVDPGFKGLDRVQREDLVWPFIERLPRNAKADISMLLLLTPAEKKESVASAEFDEPGKSLL